MNDVSTEAQTLARQRLSACAAVEGKCVSPRTQVRLFGDVVPLAGE